MLKPKRDLLQIGPLPPGLERLARERYGLEPLWTQPDRARFLTAQAGRFAGAITMSRHGCQADVFAALGASARPAVVACFGVGFEGIDLAAAGSHKVAVSTTPDVLTDCVADLAFTLLLSVARQIVPAVRFVQAGQWQKGAFPLATKLSGKRLGIVGLGRIGQAIARRAAGFDMTIAYTGQTPKPDMAYRFVPDIIDLARSSDVLVLSCPGGAATHHLVDAAVLEALGPRGFLINIARGSVVDEAALAAAIEDGTIGGAGLDVYAREPHVPPSLLVSDRVVALPHIAAATHETRAAMEQLVIDNLESFFSTGQVLTPPR